jgi:UDP-glucose 4-epimerase
VVVDDLSTGNIYNLKKLFVYIDFKKLNINDYKFKKLIQTTQFDVIFHLASNAYVPTSCKNPRFDYESNLANSFRLFELLRHMDYKPILIYFSSAAVYGEPKVLPVKEDASTIPISPYGVSKLASERYLSVYSKLYGIKGASIRLFSCYGKRQHKQIVYDFMNKLYNNPKELEIIGNGAQTRDLIYVKDVVNAAICVAERGNCIGEVYNVATGKEITTLNLAKLIANAMNLTPKFKFTGVVRAGDPNRWVADIEKITKLGFIPNYSLKDGIKETVEWFLKERLTKQAA